MNFQGSEEVESRQGYRKGIGRDGFVGLGRLWDREKLSKVTVFWMLGAFWAAVM